MAVLTDFNTGIITITYSYNVLATQSEADATPYFNEIGSEYIISYIELEKVKKFTNFEWLASDILETRYLETSYRISRNGNQWTPYYYLGTGSNVYNMSAEIINFPPFDPLDKMYIDIKFVRKGSKEDGSIRLISYKLDGELLQDLNEESVTVANGKESSISPPYVFKVFRIDDVEIISPNSLTGVEVKYRFSQDNTRSWSD